MIFAITGRGSFTRKELTEILTDLGHTVTKINPNTDCLIVCNKPGAELAKAQELGIRVEDESAGLRLAHTGDV